MKVEADDVNKINSAIQSIEGWEMDMQNFWESAKGELKATIRLKKL